MSDADINHTKEMERAYWEAWIACKEISPVIRDWDFITFAEFITKLNNGLVGALPLIFAMSEEEDTALVNEITDPNI